jgi:TPR repeat protein
MQVLVSVFLAIALLFGPAACTDVETREQRFAKTEKKADGGNVPALYTLGLMYEQGYGVTQDKSRAALYYGKAAEKGHVQAQYRSVIFMTMARECQEICRKPPGGMKKPRNRVTPMLRQPSGTCIS